jgi:tetratricopeptide (TPR) repeat protein
MIGYRYVLLEDQLIDEAVSLAGCGRYQDAEAKLMGLLNTNSANPRVYRNLAAICQRTERLEEALWFLQLGVASNSYDGLTFYNLGVVLGELGELDNAVSSYEQSIALHGGEHPESEFNLSLALFHKNQYQRAWELYDRSRFRIPTANLPYFQPNLPLCENFSAVEKGHVLLVGEQGLGDCLQFMRYSPVLASMVGEVTLCIPENLVNLTKLSSFAPRVCSPKEAAIMEWDGCWLPLLSLPRLLGVSPTSPLRIDNYLCTSEDAKAFWATHLKTKGELIVGINWQGNKDTERDSTLQNRSFHIEEFSVLADIPGIRLVSLQKGYGSEQLASSSLRNKCVESQDLISSTWDFVDTAAIICNCDLVITSDTVVAHLAAGLGRKTWLVLAKVPDWRWGLDSEDCFWYPTMRIFRQSRRGDWKSVMQKVRSALEEFALIHTQQ